MGLFTVTQKATTPFEGQKPGTSGLRKKVSLAPLSLPTSACVRRLLIWISLFL